MGGGGVCHGQTCRGGAGMGRNKGKPAKHRRRARGRQAEDLGKRTWPGEARKPVWQTGVGRRQRAAALTPAFSFAVRCAKRGRNVVRALRPRDRKAVMTLQSDDDMVIASLHPSAPRRVFAVGVLGALAFVVIYMALRHPADAFGWTLFLLVFGLGALWLGWRLWQATALGLVLTRTALRSTNGEVVALLADIRHVNRGTFAIKPAGGFTLVTGARGPQAWHPGLWWRLGRSVGVGGVTHRHAARFMAEQIAALVEARAPTRRD